MASLNALRGGVLLRMGSTLIEIALAQRAVLWREGLAALLGREGDFRVVARPTRLEDVWPAVRRHRPGVVLLDAELPGTLTLNTVCAQLCERRPDIKVLILVERWAATLKALTRLAPQTGFLTVDVSPAQLINGLHRIVEGEPVLGLDLAAAALSADDNPLTDREREVLLKSVNGAPTKAIAAELFLSDGTVRNYLSRAIAKTGAHSRIEAVRIAREEGWI
ncbi:two-component system response regulator DesR [Catenulispora sp. MAP12-49]|uniref:response regulator transcription factor n=2 Tax=unclassified Catenulispora TaxID=414885 RepID=UPI003512B823